MNEDKVNIALTLEASAIAEKIIQLGFFDDKIDVVNFAVAYAIKNNLKITEIHFGKEKGSSWNIGSIDKNLHNFVVALYPENETPYRLIEQLMNIGLVSIGKLINERGLKEISSLM